MRKYSPLRMLASALAQPWAWRVLSGAVTAQQLTENLAGERLQISADEVRAVTPLAQSPQQYWAERSARPWV